MPILARDPHQALQFAAINSRLFEYVARFIKTLLLPGGVIGKDDLSCQAAITKTLLLPGGVIGKGDLVS